MYLRRALTLLLLVCFLTGCAANQAAFISVPPGARVIVDGREIGTTPCTLDYRCDGGRERQVVLLKDGFEPIRYTIRSDEVDREAQAGWVTASLLLPLGSPLLIGTLFSKKLKDSYEFILRPGSEQVAGDSGNLETLFR
ncbi:PEGA domain-containing protein [Geothermobacter ehrlichii]|uniref:PEGA domain-containing protein n=1 Tax=Geothermobacter ehrlichii TaxID=213224 RepID=A0A5D3WIC1_9BACT|nr:PEGA domain-containing protein [Geothermobacter ehrlichii]TYO97633.1 PEGA domain-containing protein [Geothermobacter ehrlichii]